MNTFASDESNPDFKINHPFIVMIPVSPFKLKLVNWIVLWISVNNLILAQSYRWQQKVSYEMDIEMDTENNQYKGFQKLILTNNSPDTLYKLYYHLYYNAFQPGSDMDVRSRNVPDPDPRIGAKISSLKENEIGYIEIKSAKQNNDNLKFKVFGTILELKLNKPLLPNRSVVINLNYKAQIPIIIRRTGRNNKEGIDYSMAQWYPKLCNYDEQGWHTPPYISREFYAPWGDFKVNITINSKYCIGASGTLQNPEEVGCGYSPKTSTKDRKVWRFVAKNVHDFVWAADPDYQQVIFTRNNGCQLHFVFQENENNKDSWQKLPTIIDKAFDFIESKFGPYPYTDYSFIQGGDGGMEYPMATLITGNRPLISLVGVAIHELMHSWYQMLLASNESLYAWMDEGFASYAEEEVMNYLKKENLITGPPLDDPHQKTRLDFINFVKTGFEEPLSTHADHFITNRAYGQASYSKGDLCLVQLKYILGEENFNKGLLDYYWKWRFRHPNPNDFFRVMETAGDIELDWFKEYYVNTTKTIDYSIDSIYSENGKTKIRLARLDLFPMPVEIRINLLNGTSENYYIPLNLMMGCKMFHKSDNIEILEPWSWVNPYYTFEIKESLSELNSIQLNPERQLLDIHAENDFYQFNNN